MKKEQNNVIHQSGKKVIMEESSDGTPKIFCLIIEDDPDAALIFKRAMKNCDYRVEHISHGGEAQTALETLCPDVVLLDLHLPMVGGESLLHQIRNSEHLSETRVILLTADNGLAEELKSNADLVLLKPVTHIQLEGLVKKVLKRQK